MDFEKEFANLNPAQRRAVDLIDGPVMVIAGPGTGKTQLLSMRTANILKRTDALPENILCLTFTDAAAENMRQRLLKLIGNAANQVGIFTFHGFGAYIIQNYPEFFYEAPLVSRLNELGEYDLLEQLMNDLHHDNPLAKKVNNAYLHLPAIIHAISWLKQAGFSAGDLRTEVVQNQTYFKSANKFLSDAFRITPTPKNLPLYKDLYDSLTKLLKTTPSNVGAQSTGELLSAINELDVQSRYAKSMTKWRNKWLTQLKSGVWYYTDQQKNVFLLHLAELYEVYQAKLLKNGLYTFDDMILRTTRSIGLNDELRLNLQEKYQYILVDEYQDTNPAQYKILRQLSDNVVNEGRPNLMVVGDDDQAIYRFQGANSSIMQDFINDWSPEQVVLTDSYRSGQELLDLARGVIINASDRLESNEPKLTKKLLSKTTNKFTSIYELYSSTESVNYIHIALEIKKIIDGGYAPSSIVVLAPKHRYLEALVPYLINLKIPIIYERREHILAQPKILEIQNLIELVSAAANLNIPKIEALLPIILAADYWQLSSQTLWKIAIDSQKNHKGWLDILEHHENKELNKFVGAIKTLAKEAKNSPFDLILAYLTGAKSIKINKEILWDIPWRNYYFAENQLINDPYEFINFMSQIETLIHAFREWLPNELKLITIQDFEKFIQLYKKTKFKLNNNNPYASSHEAINLMTVFKAKGLEWDNVFLLNVEEDVWGSKARNRNQTFTLPSFLKWIEPAAESSNDLVRLFYVGLTRARRQLYLTSYKLKDSGKSADRLLWLDDLLPDPTLMDSPPASNIVDSYQRSWQDKYTSPSNDLGALLKPVLDTYKLSSTHLINFLAVDRGGPKNFFYKNILKVPQDLNSSALYGDSVHKTLEFIHKQITISNKIPEFVTINEFFIDNLRTKPLTKEEMKFYEKRGKDNLSYWLKQNKHKFKKSDVSEHDFSREHIVVGSAKITGKIDVIRIAPEGAVVVDYKTGVPVTGWFGLKSAAAIKANNYKIQLMFYKLLVDNSSSFRNKLAVNKGVIEFISPDDTNNFMSLDYEYDDVEMERLMELISIIWKKIITLDFPNTDAYPATLKGINTFENDLLEDKI